MSFISTASILYSWVTRACWNYRCDGFIRILLAKTRSWTQEILFVSLSCIHYHSRVRMLCVIGILRYHVLKFYLVACLHFMYLFLHVTSATLLNIHVAFTSFLRCTPSFSFSQSEQILLFLIAFYRISSAISFFFRFFSLCEMLPSRKWIIQQYVCMSCVCTSLLLVDGGRSSFKLLYCSVFFSAAIF